MTKNGIRGFAAGILFASAVFAFFYYLVFNDDTEAATKKAVRQTPLTEATVSRYLSDHHRKAIDIDAYNKWQSDMNASTQKNDGSKQGEKPKAKSDKKNKTVSYQLQVKSGMSLDDITDRLVDGKVLPAGKRHDFIHYMQTNKLEKYVQLGKYTVKSDMSIDKIAQVITKNH
ncbi:MAG: endolytic transglycosylase MltG [Sporolactobacillus sp.]|nr:endolytic transglycosylase MltG [Sporolactobacillus sp.]MCI1882799.1 endolytic transglycosylase MltG [Sporolactobacillus sp.]